LSLEEINKIDYVSYDPESKTTILTISDQLDWNDEVSHLFLIQEKIKKYLDFIESGQIKVEYPSFLDSMNCKIQIIFRFNPEKNKVAIEGLVKLKQFLEANLYKFEWKVLEFKGDE